VRQRIYAALPLPLGATSAGEWLELNLTQRLEAEDVRRRLQVGPRCAAAAADSACCALLQAAAAGKLCTAPSAICDTPVACAPMV
jgi:hypothetical protein